jgi:hypothetical protein
MNRFLRSLIGALVLTGAAIAPALASTTTITQIQTGASTVQGVVLFIGWTAAIVGIALGALHFFQHRDDLWGTTMRVLGGIVAGWIITNVTTVMNWTGTASVF